MIKDLQHKLFMGFCGLMMRIPLFFSDKGLSKGVRGTMGVANTLSEEERKIHYFIVRKMAVAREPVTVELIAEELKIPPAKVLEVVNKLESLKLFLYRSDGKGIDWAFPFSLQDTGFRMTSSTGERFFAA